ncbi:MAG: hypothetical protein V3T30_02335, partial [Thermodesulfobacteriota bacterium]
MKKKIFIFVVIAVVALNFVINLIPYTYTEKRGGGVAWFSQIEDHSRMNDDVSFRQIELVNNEDPDIQYLAAGLQHFLNGTYDYVHHPGTPIVLVNSAIVSHLYRDAGTGISKEEFARSLLSNMYPYAMRARLVSSAAFLLVLVLVYFLTRRFPGAGDYGPWVAILCVGSTLLFHRHWLKISPDIFMIALHLAGFHIIFSLKRVNAWRLLIPLTAVTVLMLVYKMANMIMLPIFVFSIALIFFEKPEQEREKTFINKESKYGLVLWGVVLYIGSFIAYNITLIDFYGFLLLPVLVIFFLFIIRDRLKRLVGLGVESILHPMLPAFVVATLVILVAVLGGLGLFQNENFLNFYGYLLKPTEDTTQIFYLPEHYDRIYFLKTVLMYQPFIIILFLISLKCFKDSLRFKIVLCTYGGAFFFAALLMRPNYHYLLPTMTAAAVLIGASNEGLMKRRLLKASVVVLLVLATFTALSHNKAFSVEKSYYVLNTSEDREIFHSTGFGPNRYFFGYGFSTSFHDGHYSTTDAVVGHYGYYPYEVILKRHSSIPLSMPNFYSILNWRDGRGLFDILNQCHEDNIVILRISHDERTMNKLNRDGLLCAYTVEDKGIYSLLRSVVPPDRKRVPVEFDKGLKTIEEGAVDFSEVVATKSKLEFKMRHSPETVRKY